MESREKRGGGDATDTEEEFDLQPERFIRFQKTLLMHTDKEVLSLLVSLFVEKIKSLQ